jgi:hypothetical protein
VPASLDARSPLALLDEVQRAREVLVLTYTATLEYFERLVLSDARALGALVTIVSDATMVHPDPVVVRRAGTQYLDGRALCPSGAFHPKLLVIVGDDQARVAIGSGNLTMAGWHANAELWTVLRADADGGPSTLRQVSGFLRDLAGSDVTLSVGVEGALLRTADQLDELPAQEPGPTLLHSLHTPIAEQLPADGPVDELVLYAPFHDAALAGTRALLDHFDPTTWTAYVQLETEVNGSTLASLARHRRGRVAWVSRQLPGDDGAMIPDERYWHGKLVQWRRGDTRWSLIGSPNLSAPALLRTTASGNCELALVHEARDDLAPLQGDAPPGGVEGLTRTPTDQDDRPGLVLLSATSHIGTVAVHLHEPLALSGVLQRYDIADDLWRTSATLSPGSVTYQVDLATAPIGQAVRIVRDDHATSNGVFVADPERLRRRQEKAIGKVRATPAEIARLGLGEHLLADLDELRSHLLRAGATVPAAGPPTDAPGQEGDDHPPPAARPTDGLSLDDFLAACDPVLGQSMTEFSLLLPALPGVGAALDETVGTLDADDDMDVDERGSDTGEPTLGEELRHQTTSQRDRYRRFLERLIDRASQYPMVVRNLAAHSTLHAVAADIWDEDEWPLVLADATCALAASGDEPNQYEREAAGSLAAVALAVLRTDVIRLSRRDEQTMRYEATGRVVTDLLPHRSHQKIELLAAELLTADASRQVDAAGATDAVQQAVEETLQPPSGAVRAALLLEEDHQIAASVSDGVIVELREPLDGVAEPRLLLALALAEEDGPVYVRGHTSQGRPILAAWCRPWLAIQRTSPAGEWGRAFKLRPGQTPAMLQWDDLPKAACHWSAVQDPPDEVADLLGLAE